MIRKRVAGGAVTLALVVGLLGFGAAEVTAAGPASTSATAGSVAVAADAYPRSVRTRCVARIVNKKGHRVGPRHRVFRPHRKFAVRFVVKYNSTGKMKTRVNARKQRGKRPAHIVKGHRRYRGTPVIWHFGTGTRPGNYRLKLHTKDGPKSRFRNTTCSVKYKVRRHHHRPHR